MNQKLIKGGYTCTSNKGITLIALVITIIVLLILAGVTISMVLGDEGIITQAQGAKQAQENATGLEKVNLAVASALTRNKGSLELGKFNEELATYKLSATENPDGTFLVTVGDVTYDVDSKGNVTVHTEPEPVEITWTRNGDTITGTPTEGEPITLTVGQPVTYTLPAIQRPYEVISEKSGVAGDPKEIQRVEPTWYVLGVKGGKLQLVGNTTTSVEFQGKTGLDNMVEVVDDMFAYFYGDEDRDISAEACKDNNDPWFSGALYAWNQDVSPLPSKFNLAWVYDYNGDGSVLMVPSAAAVCDPIGRRMDFGLRMG